MTPKPERDLIVALFRRIGEQPEFKEAFEKLPNAERNYMAGDFHNIIVSHSSAPTEQEIRDKVLDKQRTPIICLCGSTRFTREMLIKQWELTKQGYIVVTWCALPDDYYQGKEKAHVGDLEGVKELVDEVHKRKIDISDEVLVIDIDGYIGTSTRSEIDYATQHGKSVRYLSAELRTPTPEAQG